MVYQTESDQTSKLNSAKISCANFASQLKKAIAKTQVTSDFTIVQDQYQPIVVSDRYRDYLEQMSPSDRESYLTTKLQYYLYAIFNDELQPQLSEAKTDSMVNSADRWYESEFFRSLTQCNHGRGYKDDNWLVIEQEPGTKRWRVAKDGLKLYIEPQHLIKSDLMLQIGQTVSIAMPPNLIESGLYVAVGDAGSTNIPPSDEHAIAQLYFNVDSHTALVLLDSLTRQLNSLKIPFDFKIPYRETDFKRLDTPVLEFMRVDWQKIQAIVKDLYVQNKTGFGDLVPFFCWQLQTGLGLAEKPNRKSNVNLKNLGLKYCHIIAQIILKINKEINISDIDKSKLAMSYLSETKINWDKFYLNLESDGNLYQ